MAGPRTQSTSRNMSKACWMNSIGSVGLSVPIRTARQSGSDVAVKTATSFDSSLLPCSVGLAGSDSTRWKNEMIFLSSSPSG